MPDRATVFGLFVALLVIVNTAESGPVVGGAKLTLNAHVLPGEMLLHDELTL